MIKSKNDSISVENLKTIFPDLSRYLLIPHYEKKPNIAEETLRKLNPHVVAGEVTSTSKFRVCSSDPGKLTPVIFSDARISKCSRIIFSDKTDICRSSEVTLRGLKSCFNDKAKVCLSKKDGNNFFQAIDDGLYLSTGLNIILGDRSSGKTHTLERILNSFENVKYIKQFSLLQNDEEKFKKLLSTRHSTVNEQFLKEFKDVVSDITSVDLKRSKLEVEKYLTSLLKFASESDKQDSYSKASLFSETIFKEADLKGLVNLIDATILLIENAEYRDIIEKHITSESLRNLVSELIRKHTEISEANLKRRWLNDLVTKVKGDLKLKTSISPPSEIDFYDIIFENEKVKKFIQVVKVIQNEREIDRKAIRGFKVIAKTKKFTGAGQLKSRSGKQLTFSRAYENYHHPYSFLNCLKEIDLEETEYHKYFVEIDYKTLNKIMISQFRVAKDQNLIFT